MTEWILTSSVLILLTVLVRFFLKGHISLRLQYGLWLLVLVRLLLPVQLGASPVSVLSLQPQQQAVQVWPDEQVPVVSVPQVTVSVPAVQDPPEQAPAVPDLSDQVGTQPPVQQTAPVKTLSWKQIALYIWIGGMVLTAGAFVLSGLRFSARLRRATERIEAPESPIPVYICPLVRTPCLYGLFSPKIYLNGMLPEPQRTHILTHELTHYRHFDHLWAALRSVSLVLHWYNPLVWVAAVLSRRDAELACDEAAVRTLGESCRTEYGKTLIDMTCVKTDARALFTGSTTMTAGKRTLRERIRLLGKHPKTRAFTLLCVILLAAVAVGCTFTGAPTEPETASTQPVTEPSEPPQTTQSVASEPPRYGDGGLEACYLNANGVIYVWDYAAPVTVPTAENAVHIGTVRTNNIHAVPDAEFAACRLEVGTELYRDNLYRGVIYCKPAPQGSDAPYGTLVLAHKIPQWWEQSPRKYGLYKHTELNYVEYIYLQEEQATLILSQEIRLPITLSEDNMAVYGRPTTKFRTDGNALCLYTPGNDLEVVHYTYAGPQDITLRRSAVPQPGHYSLRGFCTQPGQNFQATVQSENGVELFADGTGTLYWEETQYPVLWGESGFYIAQDPGAGYAQGTYDPEIKNLVIFHNGILMSFALSDEKLTESAGRSLTEAELAEFAARFQLPTESEHIWYNYALKSSYSDPKDVDLLALFYSAPWQEPELTAREKRMLEDAGMILGASAVHVYTEDMMDGILRQYFGIGLAETNGVGLDKMVHDPELGRYYHIHGDYSSVYVEFLQGRQTAEGSYVLYYYHVTEPTQIWAVTLTQTDTGYRILSNMPVA